VLRRPPLGHVLRTAHDMAREFRVISALAHTDVPVPAAYVLVEDADGAAGVGTDFYLMELVDGSVLRTAADNAGYDPETLRGLGFRLVETLAALHAIDPADVGLADFGRPDGYLARQVRRWGEQYDGSRSRDLPDLDRLLARVADDLPETRFTSLLHGDFRLDNVLVAHDAEGRASVAAILDWEMATIGDSLADLGLLGLYWNLSEVAPESPRLGLSAVDPAVGYPEFDELCARYAELRGIRLLRGIRPCLRLRRPSNIRPSPHRPPACRRDRRVRGVSERFLRDLVRGWNGARANRRHGDRRVLGPAYRGVCRAPGARP